MDVRPLQAGDVVPTEDGQMIVVSAQGNSVTLRPLDGVEPNGIESWEATLDDGSVMTSKEYNSFERVREAGGAWRVGFVVAGKGYHVSCVRQAGESIRLFTRRAVIGAMSPEARQVNMPVAEVLRADGSFVRLYVHPEHGIVVSSLDLNI